MTVIFRAVYDNGCILEWYSPQTWRKVFKVFKLFASYENCPGTLYCISNKIEIPLRSSGKRIEA